MKRTVILLAVLALGASGGTTDPAFTMKWSIGLGDNAFGTLTADLDGDGLTDILRWHWGVPSLTRLINQGGGEFSTDVAPGEAPWYPVFIRTADLNGDGRLDLVTSGRHPGDLTGVGVWLNDGAGGYDVAWYEGDAEVLAEPVDMDDDGDVDVVGFGRTGQTVLVFTNDGAGALTPGSPFPASGAVWQSRFGDLDGDRLPDLVVREDAGIVWRRYLGNGLFDESVVVIGFRIDQFELADFDGDGNLDILGSTAVLWADPGGPAMGLYLARGRGDGTFEEPVHLDTGVSRARASLALWTGDYDDDGDLDVAVNCTGSVTILPNPGNGLFGASTTLFLYEDELFQRAGLFDAGEFDGEEGTDLFAWLTNRRAQILTRTAIVPPTITEVSPYDVAENGTHEITIRGTGFEPDSTLSVPEDLTLTGLTYVDSGRLTATVQTSGSGLVRPHGQIYEVIVTNPSGQAAWVRDAIHTVPDLGIDLSFRRGKMFPGRQDWSGWQAKVSGSVEGEDAAALFEEMKNGFFLFLGDPDGRGPGGFAAALDEPFMKVSRSGKKITYRQKPYYKFTIRRTSKGYRFKLFGSVPWLLEDHGNIFVGIEATGRRAYGEETWPEVKSDLFKRAR